MNRAVLTNKLADMREALQEAKSARDEIDDLIELIHHNIDDIKEEMEALKVKSFA